MLHPQRIPHPIGEGAVSRTRSARPLTPLVTGEENRLCVLFFGTPRLGAGRAV